MNRLNKLLLSFVLPIFCLLINVSHANSSIMFGDELKTIFENYCEDNNIDLSSYIGYSGFYMGNTSSPFYAVYLFSNTDLIGAMYNSSTGKYDFWVEISGTNPILFTFNLDGSFNFSTSSSRVSPQVFLLSDNPTLSENVFLFSTTAVYENYISDGILYTNTDSILFPGGYGLTPSTPSTPSLPSNAEIAQVVQAFYNSDYYKNNKDFSDFIVLYNTTNGNYAFIGHTLGNVLGQVIIPPNYRFQGRLYDQQWWKFYIDENQGAIPYGSTYHLYSIYNTAPDVITDDGVGKISELVNLDFSSKSVIVYSTADYPVRTYVLDETTGDYTYTDGTIEGDQYTYDENLDPTISGYNPLDNFVTVDPSQTIVGDADFEGFSNSFEEHKDLFSFTENMQWLITANNALSNYFLGFIVMCALFITLSRILRG